MSAKSCGMDRKLDSTPPSSGTCCVCHKSPAKKCANCRLKSYCCRECQVSNWSTHKQECVHTHIEAIASVFQRYTVYGSCLLASTILARRLQQHGIEASIKDGFCIVNDRYAVRHVWVENVKGVKFDIGLAINKRTVSSASHPMASMLASMKCELVDQLPDGVVRGDNETVEEQREQRLLEMGIRMVREGDVNAYLSTAPEVYHKIYEELCAAPTSE